MFSFGGMGGMMGVGAANASAAAPVSAGIAQQDSLLAAQKGDSFLDRYNKARETLGKNNDPNAMYDPRRGPLVAAADQLLARDPETGMKHSALESIASFMGLMPTAEQLKVPPAQGAGDQGMQQVNRNGNPINQPTPGAR